MVWDPAQYQKFAGPRLQPGLDLIARIPERPLASLIDLGCGTGHLTIALAQRWPDAAVTGLDSAPEMIARAEQEYPRSDWPRLRWLTGDINGWMADSRFDLIFSSAALQWLDCHQRLFPHLVEQLAPGGVLAVQMPSNFDQPSHSLLRQVAEDGPWRDRIRLRKAPVLPSAEVYDLLAPRLSGLEIWETDYLHVLDGGGAVLDWVKGTALRPVLQALSGPELNDFLRRYEDALAAAYPVRPDGKVLFPLCRLFILGVR